MICAHVLRGDDVIFDHRLIPVTTCSMAATTGLQPRIGITTAE
jgi:hypothetical protein